MHCTTPSKPGILESVAHNNGYYEPPLPPIKTVFAVIVVNELMYDGRPQNLTMIYLPREASFASVEVQSSLATAASSWQTDGWQRGKGESCGDGNGRDEGGWLYQAVKDAVPEKEFRELATEREWRALRKFVVEGKGEVVVWKAQIHAQMQRRRAWVKKANEEEEVDFHNVCDLDTSSLPPVDLRSEESGIGKKRRLSGFSAAVDDADGEELEEVL